MTERLKYIDIAKGVLIIFVVLGHIASTSKEFGGIENNYLNHTGYLLSTFYVPFYMQAFFFITGFTSNFNKPFVPFLTQNIKKILLPYCCFGILYAAFNSLFFNKGFLFTTMDGEELFFIVEYYWFLSSLFIAKLIYWFLNKIPNKTIVLLLCLCSLVAGAAISNYYNELLGTAHWHNWFHYRNALMMVIFIGLGQLMHSFTPNIINKTILVGGGIYLTVWVSFTLIGISIPSCGHGTSLRFQDIPCHILFATTGSLLTLFVSKVFFKRGNSYIETFGKHSLIVYAVHYLILETVVRGLGLIEIPNGKTIGIICYCIIAGITLVGCYFAILIFNKKPLKYLTGNF